MPLRERTSARTSAVGLRRLWIAHEGCVTEACQRVALGSVRLSPGPGIAGRPPRPELTAILELELDALTQTGKRRPVSGKDRLHKEQVLVDESQICQRRRRHATHEQARAWLTNPSR